MPAIMNELIDNIIAAATIELIIFFVGVFLLIFVAGYTVCLIRVFTSNDAKYNGAEQISGAIIVLLCILSGMFLYHKYDNYKINNHKLGPVEQLSYIKKDQELLETITIESLAWVSFSSSEAVAYLKIDSQDHSIPVGPYSSRYCQNITALIFEKYDYIDANNVIEIYKNSGLVKSINGVNVDDDKAIADFVLNKKNGVVDGKMFYLFEATLDITENGIAVRPKYLTEKQYFENPNLMFFVYMLNETNQTYTKLVQKEMTKEITPLLYGDGTFKICVVNKNNPAQVVSDSIICETAKSEIINLQVVDKNGHVIKTFDHFPEITLLNKVDYKEESEQ